jgi:hypothetical protein
MMNKSAVHPALITLLVNSVPRWHLAICNCFEKAFSRKIDCLIFTFCMQNSFILQILNRRIQSQECLAKSLSQSININPLKPTITLATANATAFVFIFPQHP